MKKIKWGIIGLGNIANKFAQDLQLVPDAELVAVASRSMDKAEEFARTYNVANAFGSYDELFKSDTVDVLYIATPHDSHCRLSIDAMRQGKHVLCEKPVAVNGKELEEMIKVASEEKVFLMEAMWSRFNPSIIKVKELVDGGLIGSIGYVNADFTFYGLDRGDDKRLLNPNLAGGSLLDIGIYPIFFSYLFLGNPKRIFATSNFYEKTGVELQTSIIFEYENAQAILHSGFDTNLEVKAKVCGEKGSLALKPSWHMAQGYVHEVSGGVNEYDMPVTGIGYTHEIMEVNECLAKGKFQSDLWSLKNSKHLMALMDEIRKKAGIEFPFE